MRKSLCAPAALAVAASSTKLEHAAFIYRDLVSAEYGPVPLDVIVEYLKALQQGGVVNLAH